MNRRPPLYGSMKKSRASPLRSRSREPRPIFQSQHMRRRENRVEMLEETQGKSAQPWRDRGGPVEDHTEPWKNQRRSRHDQKYENHFKGTSRRGTSQRPGPSHHMAEAEESTESSRSDHEAHSESDTFCLFNLTDLKPNTKITPQQMCDQLIRLGIKRVKPSELIVEEPQMAKSAMMNGRLCLLATALGSSKAAIQSVMNNSNYAETIEKLNKAAFADDYTKYMDLIDQPDGNHVAMAAYFHSIAEKFRRTNKNAIGCRDSVTIWQNRRKKPIKLNFIDTLKPDYEEESVAAWETLTQPGRKFVAWMGEKNKSKRFSRKK